MTTEQVQRDTTARLRLVVLAGVVLLAVLGAGGYVLHARTSQPAAGPKVPAAASRDRLTSVAAGPHVVFRSTAQGEGYGQVALVPLSAPGGPRTFTPASCDRVYAAAGQTICLTASRGLVTTYQAKLLDAEWAPRRELPLTGVPSRARLSRDGTLVATTSFVSGDSYANPGQFSTRTVVSRMDGATVGDIEKFALVVKGRTVAAADKNMWGVTFADDDLFYATAASGDATWLVKGSLAARRLTALREDVECPSLSPDGTRIAFKKHGDLPPGQWRLAVLEIATGRETLLSETRSVDDQPEWLDDSHVLYGLPRSGTDGAAATSDIWSVPADGSGSPIVLIHDAWSPAVVR
ncbi:hypothetical protein GCE86_05525 [Micromonospora terminaliae]|uniref:TolB-like translocation protein n=1 Tax=Micromonospora terminaliae TaxID=1914461 RepID=A0AAJ3DL42_9ACTN|nr:hypothetical protein [Micromonospora terminaliae]QGL46561.1 hypothetical protein GCE86_05525 [Micromonospora terminaliae]